jgi:hypothetical protein
MQTKLTLRLDSALIDSAKNWALDSGKSLSQVVADYFAFLSEHPRSSKTPAELPPATKALSGILNSGRHPELSEEDYKKHLEGKYR